MSTRERSSVAIVHDYLSQRGGAERVVLSMARLFPDAPLYTSFFVPDRTFDEFSHLDVRTSRLQDHIDPDRFRRAVLRLPGAFADFDLSSFDQVVVSSSAFAHHVQHPNCSVYWHTPPHFLYDTRTYLGSVPKALAVQPVAALLRRADRVAARKHRSHATNSLQTSERVARVYGSESTVIYPPLATQHLPENTTPLPSAPRALMVTRLLPYKRVDVAIDACVRAGIGLTVVGEGPDLDRLRRLSKGDVTFAGRLKDRDLAAIFADHSVVLAPGREDFGFGPVEANYAGRPVVALRAGGAVETVEPGVNGTLVDGWNEDRWARAISETLDREWSPSALRATTARFGEETFHRRMRDWLANGTPDLSMGLES